MSLIVRTDATASIGFGHLVRCLALAQHWDGRVHFLSHCDSASFCTSIRAQGYEFHLLPEAGSGSNELECLVAHCSSPVVVVFDGYEFTSVDHRHAASLGCTVMVIDDNAHRSDYFAKIIVNQNLYASSLLYSAPADCFLLLGTRYAMLRREFTAMRSRTRRTAFPPYTVLITMGGSDPAGITLRMLEACLQVPGINIIVVAGAGNRSLGDLRQAVAKNASSRIEHDVSDMAGLLSQADLVITAAGTTCWECCCLGLPMVTIIAADNQRRNADSLAAAGAAINLGWHDEVSADVVSEQLSELLPDAVALHRMGDLASKLVDGRGATRVAEAIKQRLEAARGIP